IRVVGNGTGAPALKALAARLGISDIVHWCGDVDDIELAREYNRADLFCLPSMQEGFGIVFLEAMAARKPILAARAAAVPEVVPHACLVEPGSAEALADGLMKLADAPHEMERNAAAGAERVKLYDSPLVAK